MSDVEKYLTISQTGEGLYKEKGSKFIGLAFPVESEAAVKEKLEELRKVYHDARHHCYAYILGPDKQNYRANDDGEPNHSAGDPILGQINSRSLTNVLVVVIRYFGGTKLGVSGLINAYKTAAEEALNQVKTKTVFITQAIKLEYSYEATSEVMRLVDELEIKINSQDFTASCKIEGEIKIGQLSNLTEAVDLLQKTGHSLTLTISDS